MFPRGRVGADEYAGPRREQIQQPRQPGISGQAITVLTGLHPAGCQPRHLENPLRLDLFAADIRVQARRDFDVATPRDIAVGPRPAAMGCDEVISRNTVAVQEDQVIARRANDGLIEDSSLAKAPILVADMNQIQRRIRLETPDQLPRFLGASIVRDQDLEIWSRLAAQPPQRFFQSLGTIVRADDYGNLHLHSPPNPPSGRVAFAFATARVPQCHRGGMIRFAWGSRQAQVATLDGLWNSSQASAFPRFLPAKRRDPLAYPRRIAKLRTSGAWLPGSMRA